MAIPGALMPGAGGPPPGPMGPPDGGGGPGGGPGPGGIMQLLMGLQQAQSPSAEGQMLVEASIMINAAYARIAPRSAKAAGHLATANKAINQAREALESEGSRPLAGPPDLGMAGMAPGTVPQGPPGGMGPGLGLPGGM